MQEAEYDRMHDLEDRYWWFVGRRHLAVSLVSKYSDPKLALDIGCGTGAATRALGKLCPVVGADMAAKALAYSHDRGLEKLVLADGQQLPFPEATFDVVMGLDVFEHIPDDIAAFQECFRVLKPGGVLVLSVPAFKALWGPHDIALHHCRRYRRGEISSRLTQVGFKMRRCGYSIFLLFPLVLASRLLEKLRPGPAHASLPEVPDWLNRALIRLQAWEASLITRRGVDLPWGSSVVAVAQKPG